MIKTEKVRSMTAVLTDVIGPAKAVLFLIELMKIWPHAERYRDGKFWVYRTLDDWAELLGVPRKSLERHVASLRQRNAIETATYKNINNRGREWGLKIFHCRPTDALLAHIEEQTGKPILSPQTEKKSTSGAGQLPANCGPLHLKNEGHSTSLLGDQYKDTTYLHIKNNKKNTDGAAPTVIAQGGEKNSGFSGKIEKAVNLAEVWSNAMAKKYPGEFAGVTNPQKKMLTDFRGYCAKNDLETYAADILECLIVNWQSYVSMANDQAAAFKMPSRPDMRIVLKFFSSAVNFWLDSTKYEIHGKSVVAKAANKNASSGYLKVLGWD